MTQIFRTHDARNRIAQLFADTGEGTLLVLDNSVSKGYARRDGRVDFTLTPDLAKEIRAALDDYISGEARKARIAERAERTAERRVRFHTAHYNAAKALPVGTRVQVSATPMFSATAAHRDAENIAGKVGVVHHHVETGSRVGSPEAYGVEAGRVVVAMDGARLGQWHDVHVSSLTIVPPEPAFSVDDRVRIVKATFAEEDHGRLGTVLRNDVDDWKYDGIVHPYLVRMDEGAVNTTLYAAELEAAPKPDFKVGDVVKVLPTYAAEYWKHGHPAHNKHGVINELDHRGLPLVQVGTGAYRVRPEHLEMVVPA